MADEAEDFEPYKILKDAARKVGNFIGSSSKKDARSGPGPRRTDEEIKAAKAMPKGEIDRQNVRSYNYSVRNKSGAMKQIEPMKENKFEERKPVRKSLSRSSSRR